MYPITKRDLELQVARINLLTGSPQTPYKRNADGTITANIGYYHLDWAYGGVQLSRMCNIDGGTTTVSTIGFAPKRALYEWIQGYIAGLTYNLH